MIRRRFARREDLGLTPAEFRTLQRLSTPQRIQDFVNSIPANYEPDGDTCLSVREVLRQRRAHCIEGAFVAACALWIHGEPPLVLDLKAVRDYDHVVALFRRGGCWGAISKTNHVPLRFRDPVYRSLRELAMSYFHEYSNKRHQKTLRQYSRAFDMRRIDPKVWVTSGEDCWEVAERLDRIRHYPLIAGRQEKLLRRRDTMERRAQALREHRRPRRG
ncbi:MAG TPA: hypothetical protein VMK05_01590 [Burkholderiales bacterium]|nr:hypothetical protein [Burkholderiales bacterium]